MAAFSKSIPGGIKMPVALAAPASCVCVHPSVFGCSQQREPPSTQSIADHSLPKAEVAPHSFPFEKWHLHDLRM